MTRNAGISLVEFLVATATASLVLASVVRFAASQAHVYRRMEERAAANQTVRLAFDLICRDLRRAGYDPRGTALAPIVAAGSTSLTVQADDDGDGRIDRRSGELITYRFHPNPGTLSRVVGRQSMPLADDLPPDGFRFSYFDGAGTPLVEGDGDFDRDRRLMIRRVRIALRVGEHADEPLAGGYTDVALRNRPWSP